MSNQKENFALLIFFFLRGRNRGYFHIVHHYLYSMEGKPDKVGRRDQN